MNKSQALSKNILQKISKNFENYIVHGVEKEGLRVTNDGKVSQKKHPEKLGHKLTHPYITTDYSEALLELITDPCVGVDKLYDQLEYIHFVVNKNLDEEYIWPFSMPANLPENHLDIPVANYGESNVGMLKKIYRIGLGSRYGRKMQSIAGLHYNISFSDDFWTLIGSELDGHTQSLKNQYYFHMIRLFKKYEWVLSYFFGASHYVDQSFIDRPQEILEKHAHKSFKSKLNKPLRMGRLGYTSQHLDKVYVGLNNIQEYVRDLEKVRLQEVKEYNEIGLKDNNGQFLQLSKNLLQVDNEFYATIRPKHPARSCQSALQALNEKGVSYLEVRILDLNPFARFGVSKDQLRFLQVFMTSLLFMDSSYDDETSLAKKKDRYQEFMQNKELSDSLKEDLESFLDKMRSVCTHFSKEYLKSIETIIDDKNLSEQLEQSIKDEDFLDFGLDLARTYKSQGLNSKPTETFDELIEKNASFKKALELEKQDQLNFDDFLRKYFESIRIKNV